MRSVLAYTAKQFYNWPWQKNGDYAFYHNALRTYQSQYNRHEESHIFMGSSFLYWQHCVCSRLGNIMTFPCILRAFLRISCATDECFLVTVTWDYSNPRVKRAWKHSLAYQTRHNSFQATRRKKEKWLWGESWIYFLKTDLLQLAAPHASASLVIRARRNRGFQCQVVFCRKMKIYSSILCRYSSQPLFHLSLLNAI